MKSVNDVRTGFLDFFARHGHTVMASAPLVPRSDPTLMFTAAGMVPFKNVFTGQEKLDASRVATSQKCVRAGGKHNDLDNVGYTARHHTFFEMLGNFSFGDYFKEEAIPLAWELLTKDYGLDPARLLVTVYHTDDEAFSLWKNLTGFPDEKIIRIASSDNFWSAGDTGPCGPCSEIFYDHGDHIPGGPPGSADADGDRFVEIWNLVFMQYDQTPEGRVNLPRPSIDTGMGLERLSAVLQGVHDNYAIDLFKNLIAAGKEISGNRGHDTSHRVIADHLRTSCFLIADGVLPSNEGRGYVLRRIMRRAMRHAHLLGCKDPLMHKLVPSLVEQMGGQYPELSRAQASITDNLRQEEERFKQTLERGLKLLEEESAPLRQGQKLPGEAAFKLYDTYGFPLDLTQDILKGRGIEVDTEGFEKSMEGQREMARAAWSGSGEKAVGKLWFELKEKVGATEFVGYEQDEAEARVLAIVKDGAPVERGEKGDTVHIVLDKTPFYGESGGQIGDTGRLAGGEMIVAEIRDAQKPVEDFIVHEAVLLHELAVGEKLYGIIDTERRDAIRANHSATHLLHKALRDTLGGHVTQKGSLVAEDKLRFDFSHTGPVTREQLAEVEQEVNEIVWRNSPVACAVMAPDAAIEAGAMALFGEKYGDRVRVLSMGLSGRKSENVMVTRPEFRGESPKSDHYSTELCGGTHVRATGDIGLFKITSESAVAAGVRRIEAVTRSHAFNYLAGQENALREMAGALKVPTNELGVRVMQLAADRKRLEKELADAKKQLALGGGASGGAAQKEMVGDVGFIGKAFDGLEPKELRGMAESYLKQAEPGVAAVGTAFEGKASVVVAVSKSLTDKYSAQTLVQAAVAALGGKGGGGRPDMAQGGGPEADKLEAAISAVKAQLAS